MAFTADKALYNVLITIIMIFIILDGTFKFKLDMCYSVQIDPQDNSSVEHNDCKDRSTFVKNSNSTLLID